MKYTEEEKKAIENIKDEFHINGLGARYTELKSEDLEILLSLLEKQQKEIEILTASKFCMTSTRYARQPLFNSIYEHSDSLEKIYRLENISGYTTDDLIKLFLDGFVLVSKEDIRAREEDSNLKCVELSKLKIGRDLSYDDYISKEAIREKIKELSEEDRTYTDELSEPDSNFKIIDKNLKRIKNQTDILKELLGE